MKKSTIAAIVVVLVILAGAGWYFFVRQPADVTVTPGPNETPGAPVTTPTSTPAENKPETVIGKSVEGRDILAYHFGTGDAEILFVGGIHGGYSWNTALVAYELVDYLKATPDAVPANVKVTVVPVLNPDGLSKVVSVSGKFAAADVTASQAIQVTGRFNAHNVDLNRNFDCDWQANAKWQTRDVSGGTAAFSEPESQAVKAYIESQKPDAVVIWYSSAGGVFSSNCHDGVLPQTNTINGVYAKASGYKGFESYDFYETTGDMSNWLAKIKVPAISVLLTNHTGTEWSKNKAGIDALLQYYGK
jgi:hypothetical protein